MLYLSTTAVCGKTYLFMPASVQTYSRNCSPAFDLALCKFMVQESSSPEDFLFFTDTGTMTYPGLYSLVGKLYRATCSQSRNSLLVSFPGWEYSPEAYSQSRNCENHRLSQGCSVERGRAVTNA